MKRAAKNSIINGIVFKYGGLLPLSNEMYIKDNEIIEIIQLQYLLLINVYVEFIKPTINQTINYTGNFCP